MTKNKDEKIEHVKESERQSSSINTKITENNTENSIKSEEIKQLEEKEHKLLDYFSKDDLINKLKSLENAIKEKEENNKKLQEESSSWNKKYTYLQSEFENAQKRWSKNRQNLRVEYTASVLKGFLPLYDSFKKALENETENDTLTSFYNQFMNILKSYGAEPIKVNVNDLFDYSIHEALSSIEKNDIPNNSILEIIQDGWKLDKNVIRYAKVIVSREPKPPEPEPEEEKAEEKGSDEKEIEKKKKKVGKTNNKEPKNNKNSKN
ncbi:MAG: nucleotide exchange factor GrpE [Promethearchaeota archaeon]